MVQKIGRADGAYTVLRDDKGLRDRALTVRYPRNIRDMNHVRSDDGKKGFGDKASSAKWEIPLGWALVLYDDHDYKDRWYPLIGNGRPEKTREFANFNDKTSSARWMKAGAVFSFSPDYIKSQRALFTAAHHEAYMTIVGCGALTSAQERRLQRTYWRPIYHRETTDPKVYGQATVGGDNIWLNVDLLVEKDPTFVAQVMIHEMMHCAGYRHPNYDPDGNNDEYFQSPPVKAESCLVDLDALRVMAAEGFVCDRLSGDTYLLRTQR